MKNILTPNEKEQIFATLKARFETNPDRHKNIDWEKVSEKLEVNPDKLWSLHEMERTKGEPDVIAFDEKSNEYTFFDCSPESPAGRRSTCFDHEGQLSRKEHQPENNALDMAQKMGVEILSEDEYRHLQTLGKFDLKTSSWVKTPDKIRKLSGALFCDRRYDTVFTYHNGAQSYYAARGFRAKLIV
ncbi:DUF4256 domain-containing protein [Flavobacterium sp.]|uniref:DUF4256 domain-containing protein n=1 Tax=Flavobacterium sp. TaxID=239 RepID=UPI00120D804E|nr:DUF4256 domain-containing protein [Flavobacterium sp.]RZJ69482.1 MAG: DUF4256 domain-containing protein [Flavobacterium sp.]